jgi:hypothetical protein
MTKEREYRAYAGTCVDLANKATHDEDKKHLLAMAEAWLGLADRVQRPVPKLDVGSLHPALRAKFRCVTKVRGTARLSDYPPALTRGPATARFDARPQSPGCWPPPGGTLIRLRQC